MLETILTHLNNWFPAKNGKHSGAFAIVSGVPRVDFLAPGQYYRVRGSALNDGLHRAAAPSSASDAMPSGEALDAREAGTGRDETQGGDVLHDESFTGEIWALAIPQAVIALAGEIAAWRKANPETDKLSESFGGYSYTRGSGSATGAPGATGWQAVFAARLRPYRRVYDD